MGGCLVLGPELLQEREVHFRLEGCGYVTNSIILQNMLALDNTVKLEQTPAPVHTLTNARRVR